MESNEGKKYRPKKSLLGSFNHAINGFLQSFKMERNMKIHVALAAVVTVTALLTQVTRFEMIALVLVIASVFFAELFNTAVEAVVDLSLIHILCAAECGRAAQAGFMRRHRGLRRLACRRSC